MKRPAKRLPRLAGTREWQRAVTYNAVMPRDFYGPDDVAGPQEPGDLVPGTFPFTRGIQPTMYRGRL